MEPNNNQPYNDTANIPTNGIAQAIDAFVKTCGYQRRIFERRWYNNNFFDDGFHFRFISRSTGRIIDLENKNPYSPERAIPKASRQIRGVANLLLQLEPVPVVYPEKITQYSYPDPQSYQQALQAAKLLAKREGHWITKEFMNQELGDKLALMVLLTAKHSVSYLQVWPDAVEEKIKTQVYDAFDIYLMGNLTEIYDSPMIVKAIPVLISEIRANEDYDPQQRLKVTPDNKMAGSEIKDAYQKSRYGTGYTSDYTATAILKEAYIKEYINKENALKIAKDLGDEMKDKKEGDMVIRQVFTANGVWLSDKYIDLPHYPFVDFRMEPGPIYQTALIERFIPANKSLDTVMSRLERMINTMSVGIYQKMKGEDYEITNNAGAQIIEYKQRPLEQMQMAPVPAYVFNFIEELNVIMEEQGASTSALNKIPQGVKSGTAIESVKATEYANLKIPTNRLKLTVKRFAEKLLDIADRQFVQPQTVYLLQQGDPNYFDVIGKSAMERRQALGIQTPQDVVPLSREHQVDIQIESGMGFTEQGRRDTMKQIIDFMLQLAQAGYLTQPAVNQVVMTFLETFGYGSLEDFGDALENGLQASPMNDQQLMQMKVALLEALKDAGEIGPQASEQRIMETKVGTVEALKDSGMLKPQAPEQPKGPSESISFKDLPPEGKAQMAQQAGIQLSPETIASHDEEQSQKDLATETTKMQVAAKLKPTPKAA